jgi:uncharacterized protein (TIGR02147 family)
MDQNNDIFQYSNYRDFLRDYYKATKKNLAGFSYETLAGRAGFSSPSFLKLVIDGKRSLTKESVVKLCRALKFNKASADYFENLVFFNQAKAIEEKLLFLKKMDQHRKRNNPDRIRPAEYKYLEKWYLPVIREMVDLPGFKENPENIKQALSFPVKPKDITDALHFLITSGYLSRDGQGKLVKQTPTLATGEVGAEEILSAIVRQYHLTMVRLAEKAVSEMPISERSVTNTTLALSQKSYEIALKRMEQARMELLELAKSDAQTDRIYQLNINMFPITKPATKQPDKVLENPKR